MPGFTSHYLFGIKAYHRLPKGPLRSCISLCHGTYALGEQGPDPFFFSPLSYLIRNNNPANFMHEGGMGRLIIEMAKLGDASRNEDERKCLAAYIAGLLGHYELDGAVHPYVYGVTDPNITHSPKTLESHFFLENDIDCAALKHIKGLELKNFRMHRVLPLRLGEAGWIANLLAKSCEKVYPALRGGKFVMRSAIWAGKVSIWLLEDPTGRKKGIAESLEKKLFGHAVYSGIVGSADRKPSMADPFNLRHLPWINPWDKEAINRDDVNSLMKAAGKRYLKDLISFEKYYFCKDEDKKKLLFNKFSETIGNRSLHSGLEPVLSETVLLEKAKEHIDKIKINQ